MANGAAEGTGTYLSPFSRFGGRIEAALPLDPAGARAQAFHDEWQALLAPFRAVATLEIMAGASNLYDRMDEWQGEQQPPFSSEVWALMQAAGEARLAGKKGDSHSDCPLFQ